VGLGRRQSEKDTVEKKKKPVRIVYQEMQRKQQSGTGKDSGVLKKNSTDGTKASGKVSAEKKS